MSTSVTSGKGLMSSKKIVLDLREDWEKSWTNTKDTVIEIKDDGNDSYGNIDDIMSNDINYDDIELWLNSM